MLPVAAVMEEPIKGLSLILLKLGLWVVIGLAAHYCPAGFNLERKEN
jgi:hypothetical protein